MSYALMFSDTVHTIDSRVKSWSSIYKLFEEEMKNASEDATIVAISYEGGLKSSYTTIDDADRSQLRKVVALPRLMISIDMVQWVLDEFDFSE